MDHQYGSGGAAVAPGPEQGGPGTPPRPDRDWRNYADPAFPSPIYVTGEDNLQISLTTPNIAVTIVWRARILVRATDGRTIIVPTTRTFSTAQGSTDQTKLPEGWLISFDAIVTSGATLLGQTWLEARIVRGLTGAIDRELGFARGYVTQGIALFWPEGFYAGPIDTQVGCRSVGQANPAAGADFTITVPATTRWELISITATLTTSAAAANRQPRLILDDGAAQLFVAPAVVNETASLAWVNSWGAGSGGPVTFDPSAVSSPIPNGFYAGAGFRIRSSTAGIQVGDQWSAISVAVRETLVI